MQVIGLEGSISKHCQYHDNTSNLIVNKMIFINEILYTTMLEFKLNIAAMLEQGRIQGGVKGGS